MKNKHTTLWEQLQIPIEKPEKEASLTSLTHVKGNTDIPNTCKRQH